MSCSSQAGAGLPPWDPESPAMEAWVNARLDDHAEDDLLASQGDQGRDGAARLRLLDRAEAGGNADVMVELLGNPRTARLYVEQRVLRGKGRPKGSAANPILRLANRDVTRVLGLWAEHFGRQRGLQDAAIDLVTRRYDALARQLGKYGRPFLDDQLRNYRKEHGR